MDAWEALPAADRHRITEDLGKRVRDQLEAEIGAFYADKDDDRPRITVYAVDSAGPRTTIYFVADHYVYNVAQSGSDWADHYFCRGEAIIRDGTVASERFVRTRTVSLTERQTDDYDRDTICDLVLAEERSRLHGAPLADGAVDSAVGRMRQDTDDKVAAARARHRDD